MGISFLNCSHEQTNVNHDFDAKIKIVAQHQKICFQQYALYKSCADSAFLFSWIVVAGAGCEVFNNGKSLSVFSKEFVSVAFKGGVKGGCIAFPAAALMAFVNAKAFKYITK